MLGAPNRSQERLLPHRQPLLTVVHSKGKRQAGIVAAERQSDGLAEPRTEPACKEAHETAGFSLLSGASSRLSTQGCTNSAFDSASAPRPKRSVRIAGSPAATQPRRRSGSPRTSTPRRPAQPVSPERRRTTAVRSKKAPVKGKVRVKAIRKR